MLDRPTLPQGQPRETVLTHCVLGLGYKVLCLDCRRGATWTAQHLLERFAGVIGATMGEVAERMVCSACGSRKLSLACYQSVPVDSGHRSNESRAERELVILAMADGIAQNAGKAAHPEG